MPPPSSVLTPDEPLTDESAGSLVADDLALRLARQWWAQERAQLALLLDPHGVVVGLRGDPETLGHEADSLMGRPFAALFAQTEGDGVDAGQIPLEVARAAGQACADGLVRRADGTTQWCTGSITALYEDGRRVGFAACLRPRDDLHGQRAHLRRRERQLEDERARLAALLDAAVHDLANPLAPLGNAVRLLETAGPDRVGELVPVLDRQLAQIRRVLDDLRAGQQAVHARPAAGTPTFAVRPVLQALIDQPWPQATARRQQLRLIAAAGAMTLRGDPARLADLLRPLIDNALAFSPPRATVLVIADRDEGETVLRVRDPGVGLSGETRDAVRAWLSRPGAAPVPPPELGTGLPLVRRLVQQWGGSLHLLSAGPDQGCEVVVRLPSQEDPQAPHATDAPDATGT